MKELKLLIPYLLNYKKTILWGFLFVTISNICSTIVPRIVGRAVDKIQSTHFTGNEILWSVAFLLILTAGSGLFMFLTRRTIIVVSRLIEYDLRRDFVNAIGVQPLSFFHLNPTGKLMAYSSNDIAAAREFLGPAIMYGANTITTFTFALYFMLSLNPLITLYALIPLPIIAVATYFLGKGIHIAFRDVQDRFAKLTTQAQESFSGIRVIKSYLREKYESNQFEQSSREYYQKNIKLAKIYSLMMPSFMILVGLSLLMVLGFGGYQVLNHKATFGDLTQFFIYVTQLIWPIAAIGWISNIVQRAAASSGRLRRILESLPEKNFNIESEFNKVDGDIEFENVTLKYDGATISAISGLSFNLKKGKSLGIVGHVGSGKSTIVNLLLSLYQVSDGEILIGGQNIRKISLQNLRYSIGVVPQDTFLFSMSIKDNIRFGKPNATKEEILEASKLACFHEDVSMFPEKYDTMLGERGITLSGGQKQRLAIARAILKNPNILVLDDSLSAVDTQTEEIILHNLKNFMENRTTIIISHRISTVMNCDNIIVLENGKIIESGTHNDLVIIGGKYYETYNRQQLEAEIEALV